MNSPFPFLLFFVCVYVIVCVIVVGGGGDVVSNLSNGFKIHVMTQMTQKSST